MVSYRQGLELVSAGRVQLQREYRHNHLLSSLVDDPHLRGCCQIAACQLGDNHDPGVGDPVRTRKSRSVFELDPIDQINQGGGIIIVEIVALAESLECMDRPVASDCRNDVLVNLSRGGAADARVQGDE